ncbi:protein tyrosine phosphatase family protein [Calothrix sp. 336/3]|uniref:protein tyrosine phosphatase family protein n=1 Tax=Calothrix sp. 336/3 TaxID=1337936 RepID=UPI0004E3C6DF|nr:protein tyrosine phosphatase family protein [Calothrix sp. 336/3]AKG20666.1 beta-lactamase [Calothrix sp. 336/3]
MSSLSQIEAFLPISFTISTSGQPTPEQFVNIASAGYTLVINLATPASSNWNSNENSIVENLGMEYINIPIDWDNPTLTDFDNLADLLDENPERKIWIHCAKNMRVSAMMYLYHRLRKGYREEAARRYLEQIWQPNKIWQNFIDATIELYEE